MAEQQTTALAKSDYGTQVIKRMDELTQVGFAVPDGYNYVNAIKASMLAIAELTDKNKRPALEVCTPQSIQQALFKMAQSGLNVAKKQGYFIVKGNKLCLDPGYFGNALQVKRIYPNWDPIVNIVYEGDDFAYQTDPKTLHQKLIRHEQKLESLDGDWKAAYMYLPCADGDTTLYIMTKRQVLSAWSKSPSGASVAKVFPEKMIRKTVINSGCQMVINGTPELSQSAPEPDAEFAEEHQPMDVDAVDVTVINPAQIPMSDPKPAPAPQTMNPEEPDF